MKKFTFTAIGISINLVILCIVIYLVPKVVTRSYELAKGFVLNSSNENKVLKEVSIKIPDGADTKAIASILKENELIGNAETFEWKAKFKQYDGTFKSGEYSLNTTMSDSQIMKILRGGTKSQKDIVFTIPEGYTIAKIGKKLEDEGIIKQTEFLDAVNNGKYDYSFLTDIPERSPKLEGYLFPDTYYLRNGTTGEEIVSKLLSRFDNIYVDEYRLAAKEKGYTMDQIISMAAIIEKEAKLDEERPRIAGVIYNRLAINMPLQMDSTVNYAFELKNGVNSGRDESVVTLDDIKIKSAYNTYENAGLPIGPICNPGKASIEAALFPEHNDFLYFVLKDVETGEHEFTKTLEEHTAAKNKYGQ